MDAKKIIKKILYPHIALPVLLTPFCTLFLVHSLLTRASDDIISILSYLLSFYVLALYCVRIPDLIAFIRRIKRENRLIVRYTGDVSLRISLSLVSACAFNAVYAFFQLALGIFHHSVWFYAMAGYYLVLAGVRGLLIRYTKGKDKGNDMDAEWRKYRFTGGSLMVTILALDIFIAYFIYNIRVFRHHEITVITMAVYTFASLFLSVRNAVVYKRFGSPVFSAAKAISLTAAVVSVLTLENAMLTAFGSETGEAFRRIMLGATGAAVLLAVLLISVYMIVNANRNLRKTGGKPNERA